MGKMKRLIYLAHRWLGIGACVLMLLWFASGVVMLYVGYPKLTPPERLAALPPLAEEACRAPLDGLEGRPLDDPRATAVLTSAGGGPVYLLREGRGPIRVFSALTGSAVQGPAGAREAVASAQAFAGAPALGYLGTIQEDRWTHGRGLDVHRPLHRVLVDGPEPSTLYVSSATGQVVLDAPESQQRWNYLGAWLHWLYMLRFQSVDPVWSWIVIALSAAGTVLAASGVCVGIWRWRFRGRYKSGSRSPYRAPMMKWHHIGGLLFGAFLSFWIFSGLMSMNPGGVFSARHGAPDMAAYRSAGSADFSGLREPARIVAALRGAGFAPVELAWLSLAGRPYVLAHDAAADSRIVTAEGHGLEVRDRWRPEEIRPAAGRLFKADIRRLSVLSDYDAYYYRRHAEAMNGGAPRGLPALMLQFADPDDTRVYIDLRTGEVNLALARSERAGRWLFYFLHSWDTPALLRAGPLRDAVLIFLSLGGMLVAATGIVIGWRRLRRKGVR